MERLTVMYEGMMTPRRSCTFDREGCPDDCIPCGDICEASECNDCILQECLTRLGAYEDTGLTPGEIREKLEALRLYENEGLTPDKIKALKERDAPMKPEIIGRNSAVGCLLGTCSRCGGMLRSYMKFCYECGQRLWWEEK